MMKTRISTKQNKYYADIDDDGYGNAYDFLYRCIQPIIIFPINRIVMIPTHKTIRKQKNIAMKSTTIATEIDEDPVNTIFGIWMLTRMVVEIATVPVVCLNASSSDMDGNYVLIDGDCDDSDPLRSQTTMNSAQRISMRTVMMTHN